MIASFKDFIHEERKHTLTVFDIDETLFKTEALVDVVKDNVVVCQLNNQEFNSYKLQEGESFDFHQFMSAEIFKETSTPIPSLIEKLKSNIALQGKVIIVTARKDFDDKDVFLEVFRQHGIDIDKVHVERAGNLNLGSSAKNKRFVLHKYLRTGDYTRAKLYDDCKDNLNSFRSLKNYYPEIKFQPWRVMEDGSVVKFKVRKEKC